MQRNFLSFVPLTVTALLVTGLACNGQPAPPSAALPAVEAPNQLQIANARLRAVPPGVRISVAYLTVTAGAAADHLISARLLAELATARVEIHRTIVDEDGVMRMRPIPASEGLPITSNQSTVLEPGGLHLMIFDLPGEPAVGDVVRAELSFAKAGRVEVPFRVFDGDSQSDAEHAHHH